MRASSPRDGVRKARSSSSLLRFPSLILKRENVHHLDAQKLSMPFNLNVERVKIKDLSWTDKELVLRVLFAKLNESKQKQKNIFDREESTVRQPSGNYDREAEPSFFISAGAGDFLSRDSVGSQDYNENSDIDDNFIDSNYRFSPTGYSSV